MEQHFDTPRPVSLYVELGKGHLTVEATDTSQATIVVEGQHAEDVIVEHKGDQLAVIGPRQRMGFFGGGEPSLDITVRVPTGSDLVTKTGSADQVAWGSFGNAKVKSGSGDVELDRFTGPVIVDTGSGAVSVAEVGGDLRVKSGSGDVDAGVVQGTVAVSTGSGDITVGTAHGTAQVKSGSGDLTVTIAHGDVSLSSASGDLRVGTMQRGAFTAKNASGDIRVGIPSGIPVWTDVSSLTGRIGSDLEGAGQPGPGEDYIEVRATTVSGDIVLEQI
jgi:DUF4097 and DUF4098 domain-containing protein YvlB